MYLAFDLLVLGVPFLLPLAWLWGIAMRKLRVYDWQRQQKRTSWYPQYEAPDKLKPAEVAFLYDRTFGQPELLATLFDLELRGLVRLEPLPPGHRSDDFIITLKCSSAEPTLDAFERELVISIQVMEGQVTWSILKISTAIFDSSIERTLEQTLRQRGYFWHEHPANQHAWLLLLIGAVLSLATVVLPVVVGQGWLLNTLGSISDPHARLSRELAMFFVGAAAIIMAIAYAFLGKWAYGAYLRGLDTERGTARLGLLWPHLEGFRTYLVTVEQERIKFENDDLKQKAHQKAQPYAVALNLATDWQARFA